MHWKYCIICVGTVQSDITKLYFFVSNCFVYLHFLHAIRRDFWLNKVWKLHKHWWWYLLIEGQKGKSSKKSYDIKKYIGRNKKVPDLEKTSTVNVSTKVKFQILHNSFLINSMSQLDWANWANLPVMYQWTILIWR